MSCYPQVNPKMRWEEAGVEAPTSGAQDPPGPAQLTMEAPEAGGARLPQAPRLTPAGAGPDQDSEDRPEAREERLARDQGAERLSGRSRAPPWPGDLMTEAPGSGEEEEEDPSQPCPEDLPVVSTSSFPKIIKRVPTHAVYFNDHMRVFASLRMIAAVWVLRDVSCV